VRDEAPGRTVCISSRGRVGSVRRGRHDARMPKVKFTAEWVEEVEAVPDVAVGDRIVMAVEGRDVEMAVWSAEPPYDGSVTGVRLWVRMSDNPVYMREVPG